MPPKNSSSTHEAIRCICGDPSDDGFTIQCDRCFVWQHAKCVGVGKNRVPERYFCERCGPIDVSEFEGNSIQSTAHSTTTHSTLPTTTTTTTTHSIPTPPGVPFCNVIGENIVSPEAKPLLQQQLLHLNHPSLLRRQSLLHRLAPSNFDFCAVPCFPSPAPPPSLPGLEVREVRGRGYQRKGVSTKYGLFTTQPIDPGSFVAEFVGQVQVKEALVFKREKGESKEKAPLQVTQSFVLFPPGALAIDARKFGSPVRYIRRSCRPNCQVKQFLCAGGRTGWGIFARDWVRVGRELLLPLDYKWMSGSVGSTSASANSNISNAISTTPSNAISTTPTDQNSKPQYPLRFDCACNTPEFCLGPVFADMSADHAPLRSVSPLLEEAPGIVGVRRSSSVVHVSGGNDDLPTQRPVLDTRKLSREERKLQQYIEYFERMDSAAAGTSGADGKQRTGAGGSRSRASTSPRTSGTGSAGKGGTSPRSNAATATKKSWKVLFGAGEGGAEGAEDGSLSAVMAAEGEAEDAAVAAAVSASVGASVGDVSFDAALESTSQATHSQATDPTTQPQKKRGRKPGSKNKSKSSEVDTTSPDEAIPPIVTQKSPIKRKKSPELAIVDEDLVDIGSEGGEGDGSIGGASGGISGGGKGSKKSETDARIEIVPEPTQSTTQLLNQSTPHPLTQSAISAQQSPEPTQPQQPDTPTKKKLSLSDYLKKRKASPQEALPSDHFTEPVPPSADGNSLLLLSEPVIPAQVERQKSIQELREAIFGDQSTTEGAEEAASGSGRSSVISGQSAQSGREREREYGGESFERIERRASHFERAPIERSYGHDRPMERQVERSFDRQSSFDRSSSSSYDRSFDRPVDRVERVERAMDYSYEHHRPSSSFDRHPNDYSMDRNDYDRQGDRQGDRFASHRYARDSRDYSYSRDSRDMARDAPFPRDSRDPARDSPYPRDSTPYSHPRDSTPYSHPRDSTPYSHPRDSRPPYHYNHRPNHPPGRPPFRPRSDRGGYNSNQRLPRRDYRPPYNNNNNNNEYSR